LSAIDILADLLPGSYHVSATSYIKNVKDSGDESIEVAMTVFDDLVISALKGLMESDEDIREAADAVETALAHEDEKKHLSVRRIAVVYLPLVQTAADHLYTIAGSGVNKVDDIFTNSLCTRVSEVLASEWRKNH
jgi:hypothetical protein